MEYIKRILGKGEAVEVVEDVVIAGVTYPIGQEVELPLELVRVDNSLNPREGALDQALVLKYAAILDRLPAMKVFYLDGEMVHVGGFHRRAAHELDGRAKGRFIILGKGVRVEAEEHADLDNVGHGRSLTQREERAIGKRHVKRHPEHSNKWLGLDVGLDDKTIASIREELETASEIPRLDKLVGSDGVWRARSAPRPQKPDPDEEARRLTPLLLPTSLDEAIERAAKEEDGAVTWKDLGTDGAWRDGRGAKAIRPPDWATLGSNGEWFHKGPDGKPDEDAPVRKGAFGAPTWYLTRFGLPGAVEKPPAPVDWGQVAPTEAETDGVPLGEQAPDDTSGLPPAIVADSESDEMPEWLKEDEADASEAGEPGPDDVAELQAEAPKTDWAAPVAEAAPHGTQAREFKSAAPPVSLEAKLAKAGSSEAKPVPPPPPPAKPALPPPPPPVVGRAALGISVSIHVTGAGLLSAMEGDKVIVSSKSVQPSAVMWEIQQLIDGYLSREETNVNTV